MRDHDLNDNAAQVSVLRHVHSGSGGADTAPGLPPDIVLGNIHVLFNMKRGDVKLGQVRTLMAAVHDAAVSRHAGLQQNRGEGDETRPCVAFVTGDWNATPDSPLY